MAKKKDLAIISAFKIFFEGTKLYLQNIGKFITYMAFPVLGQIVGMVLIFTIVHLFSNNIEKIISINPALDNVSVMMITMLVLTVPAFMIFFAAFWKYLVAMGALNSMANNLISGAKLEETSIHNDIVTRRMPTFLGIVFILSLLSILGIIPIFLVFVLIIMIYLCLVFQVFAFEENLNVIETLKKSTQLVKGSFFKTIFVLFLLWFFTYNAIPELINFGFTKLNLYEILSKPIEIFCQNLPLAEVQDTVQMIYSAINRQGTFTIDSHLLAEIIVADLMTIIIIGFLLPLRSICCTLLYKDLETKKLKEKKIKEL